jgi:dihydrofolate reductase
MKLAIIVAAAKNGVIGQKNQLPWHLPQDLRYFKSITLGKPIVMGRKTYESIGRPLPGRVNIVITRNPSWSACEGVMVASNLEGALAIASAQNGAQQVVGEVMVIGGAEVYRSALKVADRVYLTEIDLEPEGDAFFAELDHEVWRLVSSINGDDQASVSHKFLVYERCK